MESEIPSIEEELKQIETERREVRIEVLMLRVQRNSYRTYLTELKRKVKRKAREKKIQARNEKKNQTKNEALYDALESLSHNCIKLTFEMSLADSVISTAIEQLDLMRESRRKVDTFTWKCEEDIDEMRHLIMKK